MSTGRKPPIVPRINRLASGSSAAPIGKRPPLPFRQALEKMRERQQLHRMAKSRAVVPNAEGRGGFVPHNPRENARNALTGAHNQTSPQVQAKLRRKIDAAQRRMYEDIRNATDEADYMAAFAAASDPTTQREPATRPNRREAGRYDGLKDGQPG